MKILQLSDVHLTRDDGPNRDGLDGGAALRGLLAELAGLRDLDAIVVTGDIADDGSREAYARIRELLGGFAGERGAVVCYATGNHDERAAFAEELGSGHEQPEAVYQGPRGERAAVSTVAGWRLVTLDTLVPGKAYGSLDRHQFDWLATVLATPAEHGTVLAFHHPPIAMDDEFQQALKLQDAKELAEAIRDTDVRVILCGHYHLQLTGSIGQATVWVTPGVASRVDLTAPLGTQRVVQGPSASLVQLDPAQGPLIHTLHARVPGMGETVNELDAARIDRIIRDYGAGNAG
jgi:3',5'-cyclic AMP phosphodiesterase CpdA